MTKLHKVLLILTAYTLAGCAPVPALNCAPGEKPMINELLYFGTAKPNGVISNEEWPEFLRIKVTPRFPDGLTVWRASGQWQGKDEAITQEDSFMLNLVHHDDEDSDATIRAIANDYKARFKQEAVLRVTHRVCVSF